MAYKTHNNQPASPNPVYYQAKVPVVLLLSIFTLGMYAYWWHYQNWRLIKRQANLDVIPFIRAYFYSFFCYSLFDRIAGTVSTVQLRGSFALRLLAVLTALCSLLTPFAGKLPIPWFDTFFTCIYVIRIVGLAYVQFKVNQIHAYLAANNRIPAQAVHDKLLPKNCDIKSPPLANFKRPLAAQVNWAYGQFRLVELVLVVGILGMVSMVGLELIPMYIDTARLGEPVYMARDLEYQMMIDAASTGRWPSQESLDYTLDKNTTNMVAFENVSDGGIQIKLHSKSPALDNRSMAFNVSTLNSGKGFIFHSWQCGDAIAPSGYKVATAFVTDVPRFNSHTICR